MVCTTGAVTDGALDQEYERLRDWNRRLDAQYEDLLANVGIDRAELENNLRRGQKEEETAR